MSSIKIALLQMLSCKTDQEANMRKGEVYCRSAQALGADIALFPEMWNIGYTAYHPKVWDRAYDSSNIDAEEQQLRAAWQAQAVGADDGFIMHFRRLAQELNMAIALTYLERWPLAPRNTVSLIDRNGAIALTYAKVHTCDFTFEAACTQGGDFYVCALDTAQGMVQVGAMICYDREFPESARILMLKGAEIILVPNACALEPHRLNQFRTRAYENMVAMAMTNYAAPEQNGHSIAVDGVSFDENGRFRDTLIVEADEGEGIYVAEFDLETLRAYRGREVWGNAYRKPRSYGLLTSMTFAEPFIRKGARR
ncbi:MAG TPA: carbon-nitrogen hydrolase family protein [Anaerolineae bacterium]